MVGLLPLCATAVVDTEVLQRFPSLHAEINEFIHQHPDVAAHSSLLRVPGIKDRRLLSVLDLNQIRRVLARVLDEREFLSDYGIRSLSEWHRDHPYVFDVDGQQWRVDYLPAESDSGLFGGNSNWRGPIWLPTNVLLIRSLLAIYAYAGDEFKVECPTGSGQMMTLFEVAREVSRRLERIFLRDAAGRRPIYGGTRKFQEDPHWRDYILFYEYFHGDNGAGLGASHQTGWTGLIARLIQMFGSLKPEDLLMMGGQAIHPEAVPSSQTQQEEEPAHV